MAMVSVGAARWRLGARRDFIANAAVLLSYAALAVLFHWPLARHLGTALTGAPTGDTGSYVWNQWVFRHEIVAHGRFPLFTNEILALTPPLDLSLHNYTLFADLIAFPLIPLLGVVVTFNVVFLGISALTAWTMFLLCRRVVGRSAEAWIGGALFGFSPVLVARSTDHFSLAAAAPLPAFMLCLLRAERKPSFANVAGVGATIAWATMCDAYFGIYCLLIGGMYMAARWWKVRGGPNHPIVSRIGEYTLAGLIVFNLVVVITIALTGGTELYLRGRWIGLRSLYTPVLTLTVLVGLWLSLRWRPHWSWQGPKRARPVVLAIALAGCVSALLLSPVLYALRARFADGGMLHQPVLWRSSPQGIDVLALFMPNPNSALFGGPWRAWLTTLSGGFLENAAALTVSGLLVVIVAIWRFNFRPPREWAVLLAGFAALSLGPFVHVAGANTFIPGPWALLRYVPVLGATRMPGRFAIVAMMVFTVVFTMALAHLRDRLTARRDLVLGAVAALLLFELAPFPRVLFSARIPGVYDRIAQDDRDVTVLELPFGIYDGERGEGALGPEVQFYQTRHEKALVDGALSRLTENELKRQHRFPSVTTLLRLSEGKRVPKVLAEHARHTAPSFVRAARLGYVVINTQRTSRALRAFAMDTFDLVKVAEEEGLELFVPALDEGESRPRRLPRHDNTSAGPGAGAGAPVQRLAGDAGF